MHLADEARLSLTHHVLLDEKTLAAWRQHLADYEMCPPFEQFGRATRRVGPEHLGDFQGCVVEAFRLRSRATALGYQRGPAEDGGRFYSYRKRLPEMEIEVALTFSGNDLPEENLEVELDQITFEGASPNPVLLAECWQDMATLAAEGPVR